MSPSCPKLVVHSRHQTSGQQRVDELAHVHAHASLAPLVPLLTPPQKATAEGKPTKSAHPARFSPDDKFSRHRVTIKKRFGILLTQLPTKPL